MTVLEFYRSIGADGNSTIARFGGNEALAKRFLLKFVQDTTYSQLRTAFETGNYEEILRAAHTLKGLCGNLGLDCLTVPAERIVAMVRAGEYDAVSGEYEKAQQAYALILDNLNRLS